MPVIQYMPRFKKAYKKLSREWQAQAKDTIRQLAANPAHPSLRSHPVRGAPGVDEASVNMNCRITYERLPGDILRLRMIGNHDVIDKRP